MKQVQMLVKQNGIEKHITINHDEYLKIKEKHLCNECCNKKPGLCPPISKPSSLKISEFPLITDGCQVYCDDNFLIIIYIDGCLRYKRALAIEENNKKNRERLEKGAAVFTKEEEEKLRLTYRKYKGYTKR